MLDFSHIPNNIGVDVQSFFGTSDASGQTASNLNDWKVWVKPRGINWVYMIGVGGGGSGAGGIFTGASAASTGAVGGGSGAQTVVLIPAMFVPERLYIQTGLGGRQGAAITSNLAAVAGNPTYVCIEPLTSYTNNSNYYFLFANGGNGQFGGAATVLSGQYALAGRAVFTSSFVGYNGSSAGASGGGAGGNVNIGIGTLYPGLMVTGGAASGGKNTTGTAGGLAGSVTPSPLGHFPAAYGGITSASGINATDGSAGGIIKPYQYYGGAAGGSGGFSATNPGADGGAGGNGGPGCGGGASGPGYATTGRAGNGGDGFVHIISW